MYTRHSDGDKFPAPRPLLDAISARMKLITSVITATAFCERTDVLALDHRVR